MSLCMCLCACLALGACVYRSEDMLGHQTLPSTLKMPPSVCPLLLCMPDWLAREHPGFSGLRLAFLHRVLEYTVPPRAGLHPYVASVLPIKEMNTDFTLAVAVRAGGRPYLRGLLYPFILQTSLCSSEQAMEFEEGCVRKYTSVFSPFSERF